MEGVPAEFIIASSLLSLAIGGFGAYAIAKRGDVSRHRIMHTVGVDERDVSRKYRHARRRGVATILYVVPPDLPGRVMISIPHSIYNPGRIPIKEVSVVIRYPARFGISDQNIRSFGGAGEGEEYMKRRNCQVLLEGTQTMLSTPILRSHEAVHIDDYLVLPARSSIIYLEQTLPSLTERLRIIPGFRDFAEMEITTFSEKTQARTRKIDLIVIDAPSLKTETISSVNVIKEVYEIRQRFFGEVDLDLIAEAMSNAAGARCCQRAVFFSKALLLPILLSSSLPLCCLPNTSNCNLIRVTCMSRTQHQAIPHPSFIGRLL